jgi:hypothetical protein
MSYIVPKKMPMRCFECREISSSTIDGYSCGIAHKSLASEHGINVRRPDWCPLIELPPHGRLIDIDDAIESYGERVELGYVSQSKFLNVVIEAEGSES